MGRFLKWLLVITLAVAALGIAAIIILPQVINPNDYRQQISEQVHQRTGMTLNINGDIGWSVFPWVGLSVDGLELNDTRQQPLGTLKHIAVKVKLLPLLHKSLEISTLELSGLNLNLVVDKNGHPNWQPAGRPSLQSASSAQTSTVPATGTSASKSQGAVPLLDNLNIAGVTVNDISIVYHDIPAHKKIIVTEAQLTTGTIQSGKPVSFRSSLLLDNKSPQVSARVSLEGLITPNPAQTSYKVDNLQLSITPAGVSNPETLSLNGQALYQNKQLSGDISIASVDMYTLLNQLNLPLPSLTGGDKVFRNVSIATKLAGNSNSFALTNLMAVVDSNELKGQFTVTDLKRQAVSFDLTGNDIVVDPYLPIAHQPKANTKNGQTPASTEHTEKTVPVSSGPQTGSPATTQPVIIPVDLFKILNITGTARLASLTVKEFRFDQPVVAVKAVGGHAQVTELSAGFYQGTIKAAAGVDVRGPLAARPQVSARADIKAVSIPALAKQISDLQEITGQASTSLKLLTHGLTQEQLTRGLNGTADFSIADGALLGTNFNEMVCGLVARVRKKKSTKTDWLNKTTFRQLGGSLQIINGVVQNNDLRATLDQLNLKGDGYIDLVSRSLDYHLALTITGDTANDDDSACRINEKYADIPWPLRCTGPLGGSDLCTIDDQRFGRTLEKIAEKELMNKLQEKLEDKLGGSWKGLFN